MRRNIFLAGATGKQGQAVIRSLLHNATPFPDHQYHIYALTRNTHTPGALRLRDTEDNVTLVEGDLDIAPSIRRAFDLVESAGGIWGVMVVLMYPGLSTDADGEERQGKLLADLALEYGVQSFIYSSGIRAGPKYEHLLTLSGRAKSNIELYCKELGEKGLPWTIMRPGFFMENFSDFVGSITASVLRVGLGKGTTFGLVGSEDVGNAVAGIFENSQMYLHKELEVVAAVGTIHEYDAEHIEATGKPIPAVPAFVGRLLLKINEGLQDMMMTMDRSHYARTHGEYPTFDSEVELGRSTCKIKTYAEWLKQGAGKRSKNAWRWNQVSIVKLFTGKS